MTAVCRLLAAKIGNLVSQRTSILCHDKLILAHISIRVKTPCIIQLHCRTSCIWGPATSSALTAFLGNANVSCWSANEPCSAREHVTYMFATGPTTIFVGTRNAAAACAHAHSEITTGQQQRTHRHEQALTVNQLQDGHENYFQLCASGR